LGDRRRLEYIENKKLLPQNFDPQEILAISTDYQRTEETLNYFLIGLYGLDFAQQGLRYELNYLE
jgi:hypothetical protein